MLQNLPPCCISEHDKKPSGGAQGSSAGTASVIWGVANRRYLETEPLRETPQFTLDFNPLLPQDAGRIHVIRLRLFHANYQTIPKCWGALLYTRPEEGYAKRFIIFQCYLTAIFL